MKTNSLLRKKQQHVSPLQFSLFFRVFFSFFTWLLCKLRKTSKKTSAIESAFQWNFSPVDEDFPKNFVNLEQSIWLIPESDWFYTKDYPFSANAKFSEKRIFLIPWYVHECVRIRRSEMLVSRKILRKY